jgi:hypothetical protein
LINQILLICSSIVIYEFINYVNFVNFIKSNFKIYQKILKLFRYKNASDFRKEKLILNYSKSLLLVSTKIIIIFISIIVFILILNLLSNSYLNLIISVIGVIELSIIFLIYHLIRKKFYAKLH